jgi:hypothetical protein
VVPESDFTTYLRAGIYGLAILKCGPWLGEVRCTLGQRREFITMLGCAAAPPMASRAEQVGKSIASAFLANDPTISAQAACKAFVKGLRKLGFVEDKNIVIERRLPKVQSNANSARATMSLNPRQTLKRFQEPQCQVAE